MATGASQGVDADKQALLGLGREIDQQALGDPSRRPVGIKSVVTQGYLPLIAQIDSNRPTLGSRPYVIVGEHRVLEVEDLRSIQLEDCCPDWPLQSECTGIQSCSQDDHLLHAGGRCPGEILVEIPGAGTLEVDEMLTEVPGCQIVIGQLAVQYVGPFTTCGTAENLGIGIDGQRIGLLRLQCSCGGYQ
ncbi:Uncharacterised protein [Mycobacterium tuberculosis]|uniref:Uncharacterized protein n=1 Tax=Mycobacterium tuberculosis TaxID=1773 RepID=A0A916L7B8_MYCTX|nr:Uncharacterised protein [Mycobacterium tuberculosis]COW80338.1 Uncharacterised protein [Mycobacterium tuberculosis]